MTYKRNTLTICSGFIFCVLAVAVSFYFIVKHTSRLFDAGIGLIIAICLFLLSVGVSFVASLIKKKSEPINLKKRKLLSPIIHFIYIGIFCVGIALRLQAYFLGSIDYNGYYQMSMVSSTSSGVRLFGAEYLYVKLLNLGYFIFGNNISVAFWIQLVLFSIMAVCIYFALNRLVGYFAGLFAGAFIMLAPCSVGYSIVIRSEILSYLILSIELLVLGVVLSSVKKEQRPAYFSILMGLSGVAFVLLDFVLLSIPNIISSININNEFLIGSILSSVDEHSGVLLSVLLLFAGSSCLLRKDKDQHTASIFFILCLIALNGFGIVEDIIPTSPIIIVLFAALAGTGVSSIISPVHGEVLVNEPEETKASDEEQETESENKQENTEESEQKAEESEQKAEESEQKTDESEQSEEVSEVKLLYNPLPVPVKKERKELDYDYDVDDDANYDI